ncbi:alanine--tRNA ligase [Planktothrix agardhii]|uniref:alanine--tRNA ligase n=2 Tax=Planktothrix agardhii TaxID=1160 RepID=UPI001D09FCB6|nr:alanine--tRNA ligase [Planktothrix agardhii]MCB8765802.1 alanine--tRNA ligase [Planktothrix agardhii 1809]MCB8779435.1 alanine--tRNA ligase [Planktothrix agardhii 1031]MCB8783854.1 alanine--tRNA ligase [Planktothrix agardhii 1808]MCF3597076.1 alanine--tRNA ligase [Planktothrix agardhii 1032]MCF3622240.1 alanine--tRNA ligase [Planktothrix agardhii 1030]
MTFFPQYSTGSEIRQKFLNFYAEKGHKILPSASLVPEDPTVLLTIAGMLPFKPIFLGQRQPEFPRATTSQKCIRTNDIENVGRTARHHTFFEMLGNFSFGDYFKQQAIAWGWEISTKVFELPPERLVVSVFEEDDEAFAIWRDEIGVSPQRIKRMGEADNFWKSGPTGPCGPCSEIYYDFHPERGEDNIDLEDDSRFIEFYNLVFMQYNRDNDGILTPLQNKNIDTGMGLERMAQILQQVPNNYETDLIFPIIKTAAEIAQIDYHKSDDKTKVSLKVIGDHIRAVVHLIADGVTASNIGRGYIVRRLIRRVVRHGRLIGINQEFTTLVAETAIQLSEAIYPNVRQRETAIKAELQREETRFLETLERGEKLLAEIITKATPTNLPLTKGEATTSPLTKGGLEGGNSGQATPTNLPLTKGEATDISSPLNKGGLEGGNSGQATPTNLPLTKGEATDISSPLTKQGLEGGEISGQDAFVLYDTYGFPLELTQEIAEENGLTVDIKGFETAMEEQRRRSQDAHETIDLTVQGSLDQLAEHIHPTEFLGYTLLTSDAKVEAVLVNGKPVETAEAGTEIQVILNKTPFYAESGGQIGDRGYLSYRDTVIRVEDVKKESNIFIHFGRIERGIVTPGMTLTAQIDRACRRRAQANHTATHLLQSALKLIVDPSISQAGSLVDFERLRFDFNSPKGLTSEELQQIEDQVNSWITEAHPAVIAEMAIEAAKAKGAIAMFGEKYSDIVRVVDYSGVSMELCGGIHVSNTAEIGLFKIISETGIASGIRRIEAVAGQSVLDYLKVRDTVVKELGDRFKAKPEELPERITNLQQELKATQKQLEAVKAELAIANSQQLLTTAETIGEFKLIVAELHDADAESLKTAAERLQQKLGESAIVLGSATTDGKVNFVAAFSKAVNNKGLQAGKFIGGIAKICGGGGGGRPNLAQAGGRDATKLKAALESAKIQLIDGLK